MNALRGQSKVRSTHLTVSLLGEPGESIRRVLGVVESDGVNVALRADSAEHLLQGGELGDAVVAVWDEFGPEQADELRKIAETAPEVPLVIVARARNRRSIRDALEAGAIGYVSEEDVEQRLLPTLRSVCAGQLTVPREMRESLGRPRLSPREKQIMAMVVMGFTNRQIANKLYVAETTVKSHLSSAFEKLGVRSRHEATALILDSTDGLGTGILKITEDGLESLAVGDRR